MPYATTGMKEYPAPSSASFLPGHCPGSNWILGTSNKPGRWYQGAGSSDVISEELIHQVHKYTRNCVSSVTCGDQTESVGLENISPPLNRNYNLKSFSCDDIYGKEHQKKEGIESSMCKPLEDLHEPHITPIHNTRTGNNCETEVQLEEGFSLSLCYLEDLYSLKDDNQSTPLSNESNVLCETRSGDLRVLKMIREFKASSSIEKLKGFRSETLLPVQRTVSPSPSKVESPKRSRSKSPVMLCDQLQQNKSPKLPELLTCDNKSPFRSPKDLGENPQSLMKDDSCSFSEDSSIPTSTSQLIGALRLVSDAIQKADTPYKLEVIQCGVVKDIFDMPSSLLSTILQHSFELKLTVSPGVQSEECQKVFEYLLDFSVRNNHNNFVYVDAKIQDNEMNIRETEVCELAEYIRGSDVTIAFKDGENALIQRVAILGHSYVNKFEVPSSPMVVSNEDPKLRISVKKFGVAGATVTSICEHQVWKDLMDYKPNLTFLIIGANDITTVCKPIEIAVSILHLVKSVEENTGGGCKLMGLESRISHPGMSAETYNMIKNSINSKLKNRFQYTKKRYHSMNMSKEDLDIDGLHLKSGFSKILFERIITIAKEYFSTFFGALN